MIIPSYIAIAYSTSTILYMLYCMKKVDQNSKKWIVSQHNQSDGKKLRHKETALTKLRREVFLQCVQYLAAIYVTWLFYLTMSLEAKHIISSNYGLWILLFFLAGIQGFLNCMVYFRPRLTRYWRKWRKERRERAKAKKGENTLLFFPHDSKPTAISTETWGEIAQVEPAVDIIAGFSVQEDLLPKVTGVENLKEASYAEKASTRNSLRDVIIQSEEFIHSEIADIEKVCDTKDNKAIVEKSESFS